MLLRTFILSLIVSVNLFAQDIFVCKAHTDDGNPIEATNNWKIKPWGSQLYILFKDWKKNMASSSTYLFIDKQKGDDFEPYESAAINLPKNRNWITYRYNFKEVGSYNIYFVDDSDNILASVEIDIDFDNSYTETTAPKTSNYYDKSILTFTDKILYGGRPFNKIKSTSISKNNGQIYIKIENYEPLKSNKLVLDVWKKEGRSFGYDKFVESKKFKIDPNWPDAYFKYSFTSPGNYKISIYNESETLIKSGYFKVTE